MTPIDPQKSEVHEATGDADTSPASTSEPQGSDAKLRVPRGTVRISDVHLNEATVVRDDTDVGGPLVIKSPLPDLNPPRVPIDPFPTDGKPEIDPPVERERPVQETDPAETLPAESRVHVRHLLTLGLWGLAVVLVVFWFAPVKVMVLGVLAACAVASALHPLMKWLPGPRALRAVMVALLPPLLLAGVLYGGGRLVASRVAQEVDQWPKVQESINETLAQYARQFGLAQPPTVTGLGAQAADALTGEGTTVVAGATGALSNVLLAFTFVFFGTLYLLVEPPRQYAEPIRWLLPPARRPQFDAAISDLVPKLRWWLIGTGIAMSVVGTLSCIGYWLVGLNMWLPIGLLSGFSEVVPTLGPATTFLVALLFSAAQGGGTVAGVVTVYAIVQTVESYVLTPLVMKKAVEMPPLVTLFTIVLWGQTFGAAGLLLAIPLNLVIWTFADHMLIQPRKSAIVGPTGASVG